MLMFLLTPVLILIAVAWIAQTAWTLLPTIGTAVPTTAYALLR